MSRRLPSLTALRAFEAAARHRSFSRAAAELHVTPAAVSQLVKQLEDTLKVKLFRRGKTLALSDAAAAAIPFLSDAFDRLEQAVNRLRGGEAAGPLVVSTPPAFAAHWLIPRLDDFHARHPDIELRLLATRRPVDFEVEDVDLALRFGSGPFPGLHVEKLMTESLLPVAAPAVAARIKKPRDLLACTLLNDESQAVDPTRPDWETWLASFGLNPKQPLRLRHFSDANLVIQAAIAKLGIALVWQSLVADALRTGSLVRVLGKSLATDKAYHLVTPPGHLQLDKVVAFRKWILSQLKR
jgi:LysR family glycine cleavage system transcriptional activator